MSQFVVSARKYRPTRFEDVVGQEHVSRTLKNALQSGQIAHAFLFTGPRGVGKTTCARILARVLNCEKPTPDFEACNVCPMCKSFNENASFNIHELDAASNNSVDNIRALVEQVRFAPQQGKYKIYIIDEVHMLSSGAFNAFLKTLEEPPPYAIFILATTERHKILPTILSRCQIYDFRRIDSTTAAAHLNKICSLEGITAEPDALHIIGQKADGALRDALSIFDRVTSATGKKVTYDDVIEQLNILDYDYYFKVADALLLEDVSRMLLLFNEVLRKGFDPDVFLNGFAGHLRNLLVTKDPATLSLLDVGDNVRERYKSQAAAMKTNLLLGALHIANDADVNYKLARNKPLHVEMALIRMTFLNRTVQTQLLGGDVPPPAAPPSDRKPADAKTAGTTGVSASNPQSTPPPTVSGSTPTGLADRAPDSAPPPTAAGSAVIIGGASDILGDFSMPNVSLAQFSAAVKDEERTQAEKAQEFTFDLLLTFWQEYLGRASQFANASLKSAQILLNEKKVTITVTGEAAKSYLLQDLPELRDRIKADLHVHDLQFEVMVDTSATPVNTNTPKKPVTAREKFEQMITVNPLVNDLRKAFDLRPDDKG